MNSWSRLCWPSLTSNLSPNFCWYQSSQSRVARSASMPLAVCKVSRLVALRLPPWICSALALNSPPFQPNAGCVSICSVAVVRPLYSKPWRTPPVTLPNTSLFSTMLSAMPYLDRSGRRPHMYPSRFGLLGAAVRKPNGEAATPAFGVGGAGFVGFSGDPCELAGTAAAPTGVDTDSPGAVESAWAVKTLTIATAPARQSARQRRPGIENSRPPTPRPNDKANPLRLPRNPSTPQQSRGFPPCQRI